MGTGLNLVDELVYSLKTGPDPELRHRIRLLFSGAQLLDVFVRFVHLSSRLAASTPNLVNDDEQNWIWRLDFAGQGNTSTIKPQLKELSDALSDCSNRQHVDTLILQGGVLELRSPIFLEPDPSSSSVGHGSKNFLKPKEVFGWLVVRVLKENENDGEITELQDACLQLAHALSDNNASLAKLVNTLLRLLLCIPHAHVVNDQQGYDESLCEEDMALSHPEFEDDLGNEVEDDSNARSFAAGRESTSLSLTPFLTFRDTQAESCFKSWQAVQMFRYDVLTFCLCIFAHSVVVFLPGTAYNVVWRIPAWKWIAGYVHIPLLAIAVIPSTRKLYCEFRDLLLLSVYLWELYFNNFLMENYRGSRDLSFSCNGQAYAYLWLPLSTVFCQARFALLAPIVVASIAMSLHGLFELCRKECGETTALHLQCFWIAVYKITAMVALALAVVYVVEWKARRVWRARN
jgi:hypothetical protein